MSGFPQPSTIERLNITQVSVVDFGAVGDTNVDDTAAIAAAVAAAARLTSPTLIFPGRAGYKTSSTITIPPGISVDMQAPIRYVGASPGIGLDIGSNAVDNSRISLRLQITRVTVADWLDEGDIGIRLVRLRESFVDIRRCDNFTVGLQCLGDSGGFVYNTVQIERLNGAKVSIDCTNKNLGWCNENYFYGGMRIAVPSSTHPTLDRIGIRVDTQDGSYLDNNNNVFEKPSFELNGGSAEALPILVANGSQNTFKDVRTEGNDSILIRTQNASQLNRVSVGYGEADTESIDDQGANPSTIVDQSTEYPEGHSQRLVWQSGPLHKIVDYYDATKLFVPGCALGTNADATDQVATTLLVPNADNLEIPSTRTVGIYLRTDVIKRFCVVIDGNPGGRVVVRCYDAAGVILDNTGPDTPYVKGLSGTTYSYLATYGKCWRTGADSIKQRWLVVGDTVESIYVAITGGTAAAKIRRISIFTPDKLGVAALTGLTRLNDGLYRATQAPASGTHTKGDIRWNDNPATTQPIGWVCTADGTPGTWSGFGVVL